MSLALIRLVVLATELSARGHVRVDPERLVVLNEEVRSLLVAVSVYGGTYNVATLRQVFDNLEKTKESVLLGNNVFELVFRSN